MLRDEETIVNERKNRNRDFENFLYVFQEYRKLEKDIKLRG